MGGLAAPSRDTGACGQVGPNAAAEIGELRLEVGGTGACHRRSPIGGAAKRILSCALDGFTLRHQVESCTI